MRISETSKMRIIKPFLLLTFFLLQAGCTPFDKIYSHDFNDGYFKLKTPDKTPERIYLKLTDDSIGVYPVLADDKSKIPDTVNFYRTKLNSITPGTLLYNSTFIKTSADIDLSTVLLKFRPSAGDVPSQLNANLNGVLYTGFRKDYFKIKSSFSPLRKTTSYIRHTGFDFGVFAGIGITPVNYTVTMNRTFQEYDGIVFQKGISIFATYENMSVGLALGFDNLLDQNKSIWVFNNKPWIGLVLGIANF
jgi:hypothetical protein